MLCLFVALQAGGRIRAELGQVAHRMHLERVIPGEGFSGGASSSRLPSAEG